jgi:hypothetical protein
MPLLLGGILLNNQFFKNILQKKKNTVLKLLSNIAFFGTRLLKRRVSIGRT